MKTGEYYTTFFVSTKKAIGPRLVRKIRDNMAYLETKGGDSSILDVQRLVPMGEHTFHIYDKDTQELRVVYELCVGRKV